MATARTYDARPDRLDLRDLPYRPPLRSLPPRFPSEPDVTRFLPGYVGAGLVLDQGTQGACTGFGLACVANYLFWVRAVADQATATFLPVSPRMFYELARRYDEWPGADYEGSSCRGALKGWHKHGVCSAQCWPYADKLGKFVPPKDEWAADAATRPLGVYYRVDRQSIVELQAAITDIGAIYVSADAHDGWDALQHKSATAAPRRHDDLPEIRPIVARQSRGGHAVALVGYNERGFIVQNSWGTAWGAGGFAVLPYDDWIVHATDAWACALGVPARVRQVSNGEVVSRAIVASAWRIGRSGSLTDLDARALQPGNPAEDPWPVDHPYVYKAYQPWTTAMAYEHSLVTGNDGELVQTEFTRDPADKEGLARQVVCDTPLLWAKDPARTGPVRVVIYAHGGLNSEEESIRRIRVLGPCFEANGVYPLFLTWKTGPGETLCDMVQDWTRRVVGAEAMQSRTLLEALGDAKDRAVEALARVLGKGIWSEMRENAAAGAQSGHGLDLLVRNLAALRDGLKAAGKTLELHVVGHSAGSILLGHFLSRAVREPQPLAIRTATLYAAACSSRFANEHYLPAAARGVLQLSDLVLYVLSDENEKDDALPNPRLPAYGKSLLYLVSRALDDQRKMPLLGMWRAQDPNYAKDDDQWAAAELQQVQDWQAQWKGTVANGRLREITTPTVKSTRTNEQAQATHGSFDNNIEAVGETILRITGQPKLVSELEWLDY